VFIRVRHEDSKQRPRGNSTDLLGALLLSGNLLLLGHDSSFVLEAECQRETDEESRGGDDPCELTKALADGLDDGRGSGHSGANLLACGGRDDVDQGGDTVEEGLVAVVLGLGDEGNAAAGGGRRG
jgi:hypothetical protein